MNSRLPNTRRSSATRWLLFLSGLLLAGCGRNDIQVYRVAKEPLMAAEGGGAGAVAQSPAALPPGHPSATPQAGPGITYELPPGWQEVDPGQMRVAAFHVQANGKQADVGVVPLPGLMGHDLENANRWRSTVGLPAATEEDLPKLAQPVVVAGEPAKLYEQAGENSGSGEKTRIIVAVAHHDNVAWYFKINGDDELVAKEKPAFIDFLKTVHYGAAAAQLPPSHPPISGVAASPAGAQIASSENKPKWQVPAGWQEVAGGQFLVAKFMIEGADNAQAAVNVSMSAGEGGGLAMNVNRWRKQLGLNDLSDSELNRLVTSIDTETGKANLVDMTGIDARTSQKARLIGAVIPRPNQTWFYKLMGDEQVVGREKDVFIKFVQTVKY